jgi:hypothetical protein
MGTAAHASCCELDNVAQTTRRESARSELASIFLCFCCCWQWWRLLLVYICVCQSNACVYGMECMGICPAFVCLTVVLDVIDREFVQYIYFCIYRCFFVFVEEIEGG